MKRVSQRGMYNAVADINIVPLMDLVFNLLIVFMLTTPLLEHSIDIKLPPTQSGSSIEPKDVTTFNLDSAGRLFLNGRLMSLKELEDYARGRVQTDPNHAMLVRGDERVPYGKFIEVIDTLKKAKVTRLGIVGMVGKQ
jgi:biopolymer transport protein ExbD